MSSQLSSKSYADRMRNCFLVLSWMVDNKPSDFKKFFEEEDHGKEISEILFRMISLYKNQKKGRKTNFSKFFSMSEVSLLWRIRDKSFESDELIHMVYNNGMKLVDSGFINIIPDNNLKNWEICLSPSGKLYADHLERPS